MTATTTPVPSKTKPGLVALVEKYAGPGEPRPIEVVEAPTKREMRTKLADPAIAQVLSLIRGRKLNFKENRNVQF